jgi:hypothetical protein
LVDDDEGGSTVSLVEMDRNYLTKEDMLGAVYYFKTQNRLRMVHYREAGEEEEERKDG